MFFDEYDKVGRLYRKKVFTVSEVVVIASAFALIIM